MVNVFLERLKCLFVNLFLGITFATAILFCVSCTEKNKIEGLTVEYTENYICVDTKEPRFGWRMKSDNNSRCIFQTAYQIEVIDEDGNNVWNSGKIESDQSQNIIYNGETLLPKTRYDWTVTVWNNIGEELTGKSWFETSLMSSNDIDGWNGAKWIGGSDDDMVLYSHYLPVFKMNLSFKMKDEAEQKKVGFIYGANDERLMDSNKNIYHIANLKDESYVKVEVDMSNALAVLNVYRVGYHNDDRADKPLVAFSIPSNVINKSNATAKHTVTLYSNLGFTAFYVDGNKVGEFNLNPLGRGGDFIAFPVVGDVGFTLSSANDFSEATMDICNFRSPENRITTVVMEPEKLKSSGKDIYIENPSCNSMPMLRTVFTAEKKEIKKARLYATARGIYEIYINGQRADNDYFNPGVTQYNRTHLYQVYDVTDMLNQGKNAIGALLAEGWWSGASTYTGENWNFFGDRQSLLAQLIITYNDGTEQVITTSPETWKYYSDGPIVYGSFFQGEIYDSSKEKYVDGWTTAVYDDSEWKNAMEIPLEGYVCKDVVNGDEYQDYNLIAQYGQTVKAIKTLTAQSVEEVRTGIFVYDMGQNMVGVPEITLSGMESGKVINMRFAEVKYPELPRYAGNEGMIMLENIRAAMAQDKYITSGGSETYSPRFTYHGYRYIEITGIEKALPVENVKGIVLSSIDKLASHYETSNEKVNKLWNNIVWSTYANFLSIPTDCPQRNERLGWAGDISVFSRTSTYLADVSQFLRRYLQAMRDVQRKDGRFADVVPLGIGFGGLLWGSAGITVPWEIYQQYGDEAVLSEHFALNLVNTVKRENTGDDGKTYPQYSLMTGFIGTAWISKALSDNGYDDVAYNLLQQTSYPSWLYSVEQGATTIWERLNSYTHVDGFGENNRMNSFNHYSFGAVGAWMYAYSLGIMRDEANPGFKHFILSPRIDPTGKMTFAEGYFDSLYGRIESAWTVIDGKIIYSLTVPANTTASLCIPAKDMESILESGKSIQKAEGILSSEFNDGKVMIELGSGKYEFTVIR
ncbi:alpha-L-rhamnosidase [uncultured Bacteroides sp.]|uniref:alpha-L-rhamnosidase n=1 Tax=uncultured Bacteroides sp. TaxID=162156 RepID=UPI002603895B|nr:alpha-L-rhamnosidase [uncultured Bacteroides sp.]